MIIGIFAIIASASVFGVIVGAIAKCKHRNRWLWGVTGALGGFVALVAILCFRDFGELAPYERQKSRRREWIIFAIILVLYAVVAILSALSASRGPGR